MPWICCLEFRSEDCVQIEAFKALEFMNEQQME